MPRTHRTTHRVDWDRLASDVSDYCAASGRGRVGLVLSSGITPDILSRFLSRQRELSADVAVTIARSIGSSLDAYVIEAPCPT